MSTLAHRTTAPVDLPELSTIGLQWRPVSLADLPALTALVGRIEAADGARFRTSLAGLTERLTGSWCDLPNDTRVGLDSDGVPRAWVGVERLPGDVRVIRSMQQGGVDPQWRRRGIGRALVTWATARSRQQLAAVDTDAPGRIGLFGEDSHAVLGQLYTEAGFTPIRYYVTMRRNLADPLPESHADSGLTIIPWSDELDDSVRVAHNEAFADHWGSEPRTPESWQIGGSVFAPEWSFIAVNPIDGDVAGYLVSTRQEQDWPVVGYRFGYIDLLGVRRRWRGRGLAVDLLTAAIAAFRADQIEWAEITVDTANPSGAHGLYANLGFTPVHTETLLSIEL